ncbi:importin subunit beta-1-like isoform X2 [Ptychodera flava]|uniref:importin subunit beta-1-like isoform X2 n=1 Tax=Ptychodera flava TaxID=63121 RepID=UPI003969D5DF
MEIMEELVRVLEATVSPDQTALQSAQESLEKAAQNDFNRFLLGLSEVLADAAKSQVARMAAGLQLKNALTSKDPVVKMQYQQRWLSMDPHLRTSIKRFVLQTLGTEIPRPSSAAQCVACIACAEIPHNQWPDLIGVMVHNVTNATSTESLKESTLEAIGYMCQDMEPDHLASQSNEILTAIVQGMRKEEPSNHVRLAATNALLNSLEFTKANFDKDAERHFIMQVVCEGTQCTDFRVKVAALQCLVKIMSLYYHHMETYMGPALFAITVEAMKNEEDEVALQGIEFWSTVCDEEMDLAIEQSEAQEQGRPPEHISRFYAKGALQYLVPLLTQTLTKQEETDDDDEWNPCKAAGVCLMLLATCCEDDVVPHILPFVKDNIKHKDWHYREASVMAFGSILEGPEPNILKPLVVQAMPILVELLTDESVVVRDTTAWTIGRICELLPDAAINDTYLQPLLEALKTGLAAEPRVAANVCWAISSLAEAAYEAAEIPEDAEEPTTYYISSSFEELVSKLLATTDRADAHQSNLRSAAYEALMELVKNSAKDCYATVQQTIIVVLERIQSVLQLESQSQTSSERMQYSDLQSLLCATLQVCLAAVGLIGDLSRALGGNLLPFCDELMYSLLENLGNEVVHRSVKPQILSVFGDIALAIGPEFKKYLDVVMTTLLQATQANVEKSDYDMIDYLNELREGCLEAYTGIVQGLKGDADKPVNADVQLVQPHVTHMINFVENIAQDEDHSDSNTSAAAGLIGDLCTAFCASMLPLVEKPSIQELLQEGRRSKTNKTKTLASWATKEIRKLKSAQ